MNDFLRKLRAVVDQVNANREFQHLLCASFGERSWRSTCRLIPELADRGLNVQA